MRSTPIDLFFGLVGLVACLVALFFFPLFVFASLDGDRGSAEIFGWLSADGAIASVILLGLYWRGEILGLLLLRRQSQRRAGILLAPPPPLRLAMKAHRAQRCAYCHDAFRESDVAQPCSGCQTWIHRDCWREALLCPSLGCRNARTRGGL